MGLHILQCSSSLVAVHQAVQLLRSGDSDVAVAAGANLILGPELYIGEAKLNMLSPTGRSRMWDADADGYARGEGVASVILKRLSDAIRDGDHIECVIRESGVNSDGRTKGITMPNELAQAELIRRVYHKAGLDPLDEAHRCQFFEAHGTGTNAGDARVSPPDVSFPFSSGYLMRVLTKVSRHRKLRESAKPSSLPAIQNKLSPCTWDRSRPP